MRSYKRVHLIQIQIGPIKNRSIWLFNVESVGERGIRGEVWTAEESRVFSLTFRQMDAGKHTKALAHWGGSQRHSEKPSPRCTENWGAFQDNWNKGRVQTTLLLLCQYQGPIHPQHMQNHTVQCVSTVYISIGQRVRNAVTKRRPIRAWIT